MKKELQEIIFESCPLLYSDRNKSINESAIAWGIQCADGWFDLILELSVKLERLVISFIDENKNTIPCMWCGGKEQDKHINCGPNKRFEPRHPKADCVKEKFASLRMCLSYETDEMANLISEYEDRSQTICEDCGKTGSVKGKAWLRTQCDSCESK